MMCGLPGSGKTVWANEYYAKHLDKKYNVLGTNNLIDKMKVSLFPFFVLLEMIFSVHVEFANDTFSLILHI
jgi:GTPase SAR1 family protein